MKLIIAVIQDQDVNRLLLRLAEEGCRATKLASTGGFLRQGNTTLLIGVEDGQVNRVVEAIKETCHARKQLVTPLTGLEGSPVTYLPNPVEVTVGGATIFVLNVEEFAKV